MTLDHSDQTRTEGVHTIIAYAYANETARLAATGFSSSDVGKVAIDLDTNNLNWLVDESPITWATFDAGAAAQLNKVEINCRKGSSGTLAKGKAVYANGWDLTGDYATCELAKADSASTLPTVGIISEEATDSTTGKVMVVGVIAGLDTSSFTAQQPIYTSHTTAGEITATPPPGPYVVQPLGAILNSNASNGHIGVNVQGFRAIEYTSTPLAPGTAATGTANTSSASDHVHPSELVDQSNVYYVGKHGNDSNDGKTEEAAFLTFGAALAAALAQTPSSTKAFNIVCHDAGGYIEDITIYSYCVVSAPAATLIGEVTLQDYAGGEFLQVRVGAGETAVSKTTGTETSSFKASGITATGSGNAIKNDGTDSIIICELDYINVEDGDAIHDNSSGDGHIHARVADIYINGDGKGLVTAGGAGKIYATVDEIEDKGAGTTTAIDVQTGKVRCRVSRIEADTAWNVALGATLEAFVGSVTGTKTETGTVEVTEAGASGAELSDTAPANVTKATASAGTATEASRQDHKHDITTAAPTATGVATTAAEGIATSLARSDHAHQSNTAPVNVTKATATIGTSGEPARADHKHDVTTATAGATTPGDSAAEGSATSLARSDHQHSIAAFGSTAGTFCEGNDSRLTEFGSELDNAASETESTTTSSTYQQKLRLTTGTLATSAVYRVGWFYEWRMGSTNNKFDGQVQLDDTTTIHEISSEPQDTANWHSESGFYYVTGANATVDIDLDYRSNAGGATAYIRKARLEYWRIS